MKLISHRGNINGRIPELENTTGYIDIAITNGYDVEVDIRVIEGILNLGHDESKCNITMDWLNKRYNKLWLHCKNTEAIEFFEATEGFNYFWHENDTLTITSAGYIWVYPGKQIVKNSIAVLPEIHNDDISQCVGICSDIIERYK